MKIVTMNQFNSIRKTYSLFLLAVMLSFVGLPQQLTASDTNTKSNSLVDYFSKIIQETTSESLHDIKVTLMLTEDCENGIDDDGDGLADCYDSDCPCVPAPFSCNSTKYIAYDAPSQFVSVETSATGATLTTIDANLNDKVIGAIGFNHLDNYIYGFVRNQSPVLTPPFPINTMVQIDANGKMTDMGIPAPTPGSGIQEIPRTDCENQWTASTFMSDGTMVVLYKYVGTSCPSIGENRVMTLDFTTNPATILSNEIINTSYPFTSIPDIAVDPTDGKIRD